MIRTLSLIAVLAVLIVIARTHPETVSGAASTIGAAVGETLRPVAGTIEKTFGARGDKQGPADAGTRKESIELTPSKPGRTAAPPLPAAPASPTAPSAAPDHIPPTLPADPVTPGESKVATRTKSENHAGRPAVFPPSSPAPLSASANEASIQQRLRAAARFLAETDLPR